MPEYRTILVRAFDGADWGDLEAARDRLDQRFAELVADGFTYASAIPVSGGAILLFQRGLAAIEMKTPRLFVDGLEIETKSVRV